MAGYEAEPLLEGTYIQQRDGGGGSSAPPVAIAQNGIAKTALLIIANLAGAGILSLPKAIVGAGMGAGAIMVVASALLSGYTADVLSRCYDIINSRRTGKAKSGHGVRGGSGGGGDGNDADADSGSFFARSPYACIGQEAVGKAGAVAVTTAQFMTQFSVMVVFFLISGINLNKLMPSHTPLFYSLVCTAALTPLMLLRPGHVWGTALLAILATSILVVVIVVLCTGNYPHDARTPVPDATFSSFGTAFGVILFGFGGHAILPALQATMANPTPGRFRAAIGWSFLICTGLYLTTSLSAVALLGGTVSGDILTNFETGFTNDFGLVAVTAHLLFAAVTVHIPVGQIIDHYCGASDLGGKQIAIRVLTMALVAATIWAAGDHFFCVIGLVGGTCSNAMIFIFPPWFYVNLLPKQERTTAIMAKMTAIGTIGVLGMVAALIGAVDSCGHGNRTGANNHTGAHNHSNRSW